jgi:long-chain acyl-CoA synthetase
LYDGAVQSLSAIVTASAAAVPDKPALVFRNRPIPYGEFEEWIRLSAGGLHSLGIRKPDRVALVMGNVPEFLYAFYGVVSIGAVAVPLEVTLTPDELSHILANCEARAVIVEIDFLPAVLAIRDRVPSIEHVLVVGPPPTPRGTRSLDELLDRSPGGPPQPEVNEADLAVLAYTTGTTADPKGAMLSHGNLLANLRQVSAVPALKLDRTDVVLAALPLFSPYALHFLMGMTLKEGCTGLLAERFDAEEVLALSEERRATVWFGTPAMFRSLLRSTENRDGSLSSLRVAVGLPPPFPLEVLQGFRERFGVDISEAYGHPETGPVLCATVHGAGERSNSIGVPLPDLEVRLVDGAGGDVEEGDPGELMVRGPNVSTGYWGDSEDPDSPFEDGWFRTGDLAYRDEAGAFFLVGRKSDVIRVIGFSVFPNEVEEVLSRHPDVAECTVIGVPDERTGEAVKALVVLKPGATATEEEIREYCGTFLARFKCPTTVEFVESLPSAT